MRKKLHLLGKLCKIRVTKFQFAFNFPSLMWVPYDVYNHGVARRRSWFRQAVLWGRLLWNIEEGCKSQLIFADKVTLFLAHNSFRSCSTFRNCLLFPERTQRTMKWTIFLTLLPKWREIGQMHLEFTATSWSSEIAQRLTFFNLKSCKRQNSDKLQFTSIRYCNSNWRGRQKYLQ